MVHSNKQIVTSEKRNNFEVTKDKSANLFYNINNEYMLINNESITLSGWDNMISQILTENNNFVGGVVSNDMGIDNIVIQRSWAMPNKNTFSIPPIRQLIEEEMTDGTWIDPYANTNKLATITNDLDTKYDTDYHLDALDFLKTFKDSSVDGILFDPPYSPRQVAECYHGFGYDVNWKTTSASFWKVQKEEISRIVKPCGKAITFGWNSGGVGIKYGFTIQRILLVAHGGWHNDTICTVEIKDH